MKSDIRVCDDWRTHHDRPVYTLGDTCPACGGQAVNSAPAPFDPTDRYGDYRRRLKRRHAPDEPAGPGDESADPRDERVDPGDESADPRDDS